MDLYFLRHGKAEPVFSDDSELTTTGIESIRNIARAIKALNIQFDQILCSDLQRAQETAAIIQEVLEIQIEIGSCTPLTPPGDCDDLLQLLKDTHRSSVLMVGHEPMISRTISRLISGDEQSFITIKKGSLAKVFIAEYTRHVRGSLEWLLTPNALMKILESKTSY
jgi:phosphohistidine phosphatase